MNMNVALDEHSGQIKLKLEKNSTTQLTREVLIELLHNEGFQDAFLLEDNIERLLAKSDHTDNAIETVVAEVRNGEASIIISEDDMRAYLNLTPAFGGTKVNTEDIHQLLHEQKIIQGIKTNRIEEAIELGECQRLEIAHGCYPSKQQESIFESLVPEPTIAIPNEDEAGRVEDMVSSTEYVVVDIGTPLMRRLPPKEAKDGHDIFGRTLKAPPVKMRKFSSSCRGAIVSPEDENLLIAEIKGHPVAFDNGVNVDPTLVLPAVNLSSGHIDYDGSIVVKGDVASQMSVTATGDVTIEGIVNAAQIKAGGNVICHQGIIGGASRNRQDEDLHQQKGANISAEGKVVAAFIDNAHVKANGQICAREYICHSLLETSQCVLVGEGGKGNIFGGRLCARGGLKVRILGSQAYIKTNVTVGVDPEILEAYQQYTAQITELDFEMVEVKLRLKQLENPKNDLTKMAKIVKVQAMKADTIKKIDQLHDQLSQLVKKQSELQQDVEEGKDAKVVILDKAYPGTTIHLLNKTWEVTEAPALGSYSIVNDKIKKDSLSIHDRSFQQNLMD